jgi:hypothetical protein
MNNYIKPVDPLVDDNNTFFHADEKMHYLLENKDIQDYLDYIKEKRNLNKPDVKSDIKLNIKSESNIDKYKKQMLQNIWSDILTLENTIKKFKF